jgi:hypothetical protein
LDDRPAPTPPDPEPAAFAPPPGFSRGDLLAEYLRQSFHLFRGGGGRRGLIAAADGSSLALWCFRPAAAMRSAHCAIFAGPAQDRLEHHLATLSQILTQSAPDAASIRVLSGPPPLAPAAEPKFRVMQGYLLIALVPDETREVLEFPDNFEAFVAQLGKKSRSHLRSALRTFAAAGYRHEFVIGERLPLTAELLALAARNMPSPATAAQTKVFTDYINAQPLGFQSTLCDRDGRVLSIVRGYLLAGYGALVDQINPRDVRKIGQTGPSLLHRALLARSLIGLGMQGLVITGGCGGMLSRYCRNLGFRSYLAVALRPMALLRCLGYYRVNASIVRWALRQILARF